MKTLRSKRAFLLLLSCMFAVMMQFCLYAFTPHYVREPIVKPKDKSMFAKIDSVCCLHKFYDNKNLYESHYFPEISIDSVSQDTTYITVRVNLSLHTPITSPLLMINKHPYQIKNKDFDYYTPDKGKYKYKWKMEIYLDVFLLFWKMAYHNGDLIVRQHYTDYSLPEANLDNLEVCHCVPSQDTINIIAEWRE